MSAQINRVMIFGNSRYQIWATRTLLEVKFSNGIMDRRAYDHVDDLFELPMKGLIKLVGEYIVDIEMNFFNNMRDV